jgi:hypothetical protein
VLRRKEDYSLHIQNGVIWIKVRTLHARDITKLLLEQAIAVLRTKFLNTGENKEKT